MAYDRFDDQITQKYSIVVQGWPLQKGFCNPSSVGSRVELEVLHNSWQLGATRFQKLTQEEMEAWEDQHFQSHLAMVTVALPEPADTAPLPSTHCSQVPLSDCNSPQPLTTTSRLAHSPVANDSLRPPSTASLPPHQDSDSEVIADMVRRNPTLQNIDPALLAIGVMQERQRSVATMTSIPVTNPDPPCHLKRNRDRFQIITPQSYGTQAKRPQKERHSKQTPVARGLENIVSGDRTS